MNQARRHFAIGLALSGAFGISGSAVAKGKGKAHHHHDGSKLLGGNRKIKGKHVIDKKGPNTVSLDVTDGGKIAGMHVKHEKKGDLPITKYKTSKKMAQAESGFQYASYIKVQGTYLGTTYIGYSYYDDYGDEYVYWFPYDMILDGDTGAIEYVAAA
ncbi:MAG: hypothetical protein ABIO45_02035 [Burkholderiaceae bacterium]